MRLSVSCLLLLWADVTSFRYCQWELNSVAPSPDELRTCRANCITAFFPIFLPVNHLYLVPQLEIFFHNSFLPLSFRVQLPCKRVRFSCQKRLSVPKFLHSFIFCYCNCFSGPFYLFLNLPKIQEWRWGLGGMRQESLCSHAIVAGHFCQVTGLCSLLECNSV